MTLLFADGALRNHLGGSMSCEPTRGLQMRPEPGDMGSEPSHPLSLGIAPCPGVVKGSVPCNSCSIPRGTQIDWGLPG